MKTMLRRFTFTLCFLLCLVAATAPCAAYAEDNLQNGPWQYRVMEDGTAEVIGYDDPSVDRLTIPTQLDGVWVTAIGDGAFAKASELAKLTVPAQVTRISPRAFAEENKPVLQGWNGSHTLIYAKEQGMTAVNLSKLDFFPEVKDLSGIPEALWQAEDGVLRVEAPYAALIEEGDKLYFPAHDEWTQGMPVLVGAIRREGGAATAPYTVLAIPQTLLSYHAENLPLQMDDSNIILGEGVFPAPTLYSSVTGTLGGEKVFAIEQSENGVTVEGTVTVSITGTATIDYEWLHVNEITLSLEETGKFHLTTSYDGEDEDNATLSRRFKLFRVPLVSEGLLGVWADVYLKTSVTGEITIDAEVGSTQQMTIRNGKVVSKSCTGRAPTATVEASASLHMGISPNLVLRLGFPGKISVYIDFASLDLYCGLVGTVHYTSAAPECYDLNLGVEASADVSYGPVAMRNDEVENDDSETVSLGEITLPVRQKHWEGSTKKWQTKCTYGEMCSVTFFTGTDETDSVITVKYGEKVGKPIPPEREGYTFTGWYTDANLSSKFDFAKAIVEDVTVYAGWDEAEATPEPTQTPAPTPTPTPAPTPMPTAGPGETGQPITPPSDDVGWYPFANIPNAAQTFAMCEIESFDDNYDNVIDYYYARVPANVQALTLSKFYRGKEIYWTFNSYPIAVAYSNEYITITEEDIPYAVQTVYLPESLTSLSGFRLEIYDNITCIRFPGSLGSIPSYVDSDCGFTNLRSVIIGEGITNIADFAFERCETLKEISLPRTLTSIGEHAFFGCTNLERIVIPEGVTSVGNFAFSWCPNLKEVTLPSTLTSIGEYSFHNCTSLERIVIPKGVNNIGILAFNGCSNLKEITLASTSTSLYAFSSCTNLERIVIPEGVTSIGDNYGYSNSFNSSNFPYLKEVSLPSTLTSINDEAFEFSNLERIIIPEGVTSIGQWAFRYCKKLKEVSLPTTLTSIGDGAFAFCEKLEQIVIPEGVTNIGINAFSGCKSLKQIVLPDSVTNIGRSPFSGCTNLKEIKCYAKTTELNAYDETTDIYYPLGHSCPNLKLLYAYADSDIAAHFRKHHPNVKIISPGSGYLVEFEPQRGTQPEDVLVPEGELIPEPEKPVWESRVFEGWYKNWLCTEPWDFAVDRMPDHSITLYAKWSYKVTGTIIDRNNECYLGSLDDPDENLVIPDFVGTSLIVGLMPDLVPPGVKTVHLSSIIKDVRPGAFRLARNLTAITVDNKNPNYYAVDGVLYTRDGSLVCYPAAKAGSAFAVPDGVLFLSEHAFYGCRALEELTLPDTLTALSPSAVSECAKLRLATFAAAPQTIGNSCFLGCKNLRLFGPVDAPALKAYAANHSLSYNEYRLIYSSEGRVLAETRVPAGDPVTPISGPTRDERVLLGWSDDATAHTVTSFDQYVMPAHDLTLYAVWGYAFTWQDNGSGGVELLRYTGDQTTIRVPETVEGKPVTAIAADAFSALSSVTLEGNRGSITESYAAERGYTFQPLRYTLRFESNGGTQLAPQTLCATDAVEIPSCIRTGYELNGWYLDSELTRPWSQTTMPAANMTLYAGWTQTGSTEYVPFSYRTAAEGIYITGCTDTSPYVNVPETINETAVVGIDEAAFAGCSAVRQLYLPETIQSIGAYAFQGMTMLDYVTLPNGLTVLPEGAFQGCEYLTFIELPRNLERIESAAFTGCVRLERVVFSAVLNSIAPDAFSGCKSLASFSWWGSNPTFSDWDGVIYIEDRTRLLLYPAGKESSEYEIPDGVTAIDDSVLFPTQLTSLVIPASAASMNVSSFAALSDQFVAHVYEGSAAEAFFKENLPQIRIAYRDKPIGEDRLEVRLPSYWHDFAGPFTVGLPVQAVCLLNGVELEPTAVNWSVDKTEIAGITQEGVLTFRHAGWVTVTATLKNNAALASGFDAIAFSEQQLSFPTSLKEIADEAFCGNSSLESVLVPDTTERIGSRAFADCPWLFSVDLPSTITYIADDAFSNSPYVCLLVDEGSYAHEYAIRLNLSCISF